MKANASGFHISPRQAFTLIELLVVIAIIAILAVVVVLTLNPAALLQQSRDANRVSDMATLQSAINLYNTDQAGASAYSLGAASTSYISIPSASSSCATLGMATSAYSYACSTSANYRNVNTTGWLPVNFSQISAGSPLSSLPVDPTNQSSSNLYYAYETNGTQYVLSSFMESSKYAKQMETTGGIDPALYEAGSGANTLPDAGRGLVGYWPLDEGSGSTTYDWSGEGNNGQLQNNANWTTGKMGPYAVTFFGTNDTVYIGNATSANVGTGSLTVAFWVKATVNASSAQVMVFKGGSSATLAGYDFEIISGQTDPIMDIADGTNEATVHHYNSPSITDGNWHFIVGELDRTGVLGTANTLHLFVDDVDTSAPVSAATVGSLSSTNPLEVSKTNYPFVNGVVEDLRIYDRALSASEIQELYNAEK